MNRATLLSFLLTKRGVIFVLVSSVAVLGAGLGFLPGLLDGPDAPSETPTAEPTQLPSETTQRPTETDAGKDGTGETTVSAGTDGATPTATVTPDSSVGTTQRETEAGTTESPTVRDDSVTKTDDSEDDFRRTARDEPAEVDVQAEANATVSSLSSYPAERRSRAILSRAGG